MVIMVNIMILVASLGSIVVGVALFGAGILFIIGTITFVLGC